MRQNDWYNQKLITFLIYIAINSSYDNPNNPQPYQPLHCFSIRQRLHTNST